MSRKFFRHIPLARPSEQIRLLKLQPDTDVIRLNTQTCELTQSPAFVALSYEWGDDSEIHDIIIDGNIFKIRQNLRDALEHIRTLQADTSSTRLFEEDSPCFWIDAIAIDQSNDWEKPHQVSMMGRIYRQASHVVAWLGVAQRGDLSDLALDYLNTRPKILDHYQKLHPDFVTISAEEMAIRRLCHRSYFQRMWIVQECVLARELHLVCGLHYCSWKDLHRFSVSLHHERRISRSVYGIFEVKSEFESNWSGRSIQDTMSRILDLTVGRRCSKFHDRIYGLLGILQQSFQTTGMDVDYGASLVELMIKTYEFLASDPEDGHFYCSPSTILDAFESVASTDEKGKFMVYWQINEIMYKLDADVIKGFHSLETLHDEKVRALTFLTVCWIVGGFGVDLFSPVEGSTPLNITTPTQIISFEHVNPESDEVPVFNLCPCTYSQYDTGIDTYCISLTHSLRTGHDALESYVLTESKSRECRTLLEAYSKHVKFVSILREDFKVSTEVSDLQTSTRLPIRVEWLVLSNLLAQYFLSKYSPMSHWGTEPNRTTKIDGFVRQIERERKDLGTFLSESFFNKYRMSVANASDELPTNALALIEIKIYDSKDPNDCFVPAKKTLVASLYDNDYEESRKRKRRSLRSPSRHHHT